MTNKQTIDIMIMSTYDKKISWNKYLYQYRSFFDNIKDWTHFVRIILWSNRLEKRKQQGLISAPDLMHK
jgi:hypothetical protein